MYVRTQVGVPVQWIPVCLQRWRMLMLTVTLSHAPVIFTPAPENRMSFFSNHIQIIWPVTARSRCLLKLHDNNSCYAALTRQNTLGWHIPSRSCAAQTAIWSNYLARSLFLKLRHSSAESDVADEKKSPRESRSSTSLLKNSVSFTHSTHITHLIYVQPCQQNKMLTVNVVGHVLCWHFDKIR